ncbi:MAG: LytTR family DNA-binding domain-containing protein [Lachnospiraceae bacterium]|nr:LytTR family DNA-binding domain-containing protein [Lachnospiraceae bacterium]
MKIVVCDDSIEDLTEIERLLTKYKEINSNTNLEVEQFSHAAKLYQKIQEKELADIYILDMIMSEKTGIDIGTLIRSSNRQSVIVYITSSDDFALEAYGVRAVRYLLKPVSEEQFFEALDYALSLTKLETEKIYPVKTKNGLVAIPYSKIEYIENYSRVLNIFQTDGESVKSIFIRKSFDEEIREIAQDKRFMQVHKSFLINMNYVNKLTQNTILMESGKSIPISKKRVVNVRKEYLLFVSEQYRYGV